MEERESPRPGLTDHCYATDSCSFHVFAVFLLSTDICKQSKISLLHIVTHCDKKPRGKVGSVSMCH